MIEHEVKLVMENSFTAMIAELRPLVKEIESQTPVTRGHYGRYLSIITRTAKDNPDRAWIMAVALLLAGASTDGVFSALHMSFPDVEARIFEEIYG